MRLVSSRIALTRNQIFQSSFTTTITELIRNTSTVFDDIRYRVPSDRDGDDDDGDEKRANTTKRHWAAIRTFVAGVNFDLGDGRKVARFDVVSLAEDRYALNLPTSTELHKKITIPEPNPLRIDTVSYKYKRKTAVVSERTTVAATAIATPVAGAGALKKANVEFRPTTASSIINRKPAFYNRRNRRRRTNNYGNDVSFVSEKRRRSISSSHGRYSETTASTATYDDDDRVHNTTNNYLGNRYHSRIRRQTVGENGRSIEKISRNILNSSRVETTTVLQPDVGFAPNCSENPMTTPDQYIGTGKIAFSKRLLVIRLCRARTESRRVER